MKVASLWIGDRLGEIEQISARSFLATGHSLTVFAYGPLRDVPEGVEVRDAEPIFSGKRILRYPGNGWPSVHSNLFRYAMLAESDYIWSDLDVFALRQFEFQSRHVFGYEEKGRVNNAVLALPPDSPTLKRLLEFSPEMRGYPPDATPWQRRKIWLRSLGRGVGVEAWGHGATGPRGLTHFLNETGEIDRALPEEAFYPVPWRDHAAIVKPGAIDPDGFPESSFAIHLWASQARRVMRRRYRGELPPSSLLGRLAARLGPVRLKDRIPV